MRKTADVPSGVGTAYHSGVPEFIIVGYCSIYSFLCSALSPFVCFFVFFLLVIVFSVFRFTTWMRSNVSKTPIKNGKATSQERLKRK